MAIVHAEKRFEHFKDGGLNPNVSRAGASASRLLVIPVGGAEFALWGFANAMFLY